MPALAHLEVTPPARRLAFLYAVLFLVVGCYLPYMPVWFHWRRSGARRTVLIFLAWGTLLSFLLLWASGGFWRMLFATLLVAFNWTTITPLIEAFALSGVRTAGLDYGSVRLWGSGSFILASFGAGLVIGAFGAGSVLPLLVGASALMVVGIHLLPRDVASRSSPSPPPLRRISFADTVKLAHSLSFLLFLLAASMIQASHPLYYAFGTLPVLAGARLGRRHHRRALGAWRHRRDRVVRGLRAYPCQMGRPATAARRRHCRGRWGPWLSIRRSGRRWCCSACTQ
jgi:hypothetical protein